MMHNKPLISAFAFTFIVLFAASCAQNSLNQPVMSGRRMMNGNINNDKAIFLDRNVQGLDEARKTEAVELADGQMFKIEAKPVVKEINGNRIRMYAYNGQIPGPLLKVKQGSTVYINFTNKIDLETTIHWHGIRLENKYDGVPNITQQPIKQEGSFVYKLDFPDEGIYWYHPHVREDLQQELGLYGNILVEPKDSSYFNAADKEIALFLDDIRMSGDDVYPFSGKADFTFMGRFGNVMLVNGESSQDIEAKEGEVVRFYLTDSANTRTFNFEIESHDMKLIGSDSGRYENEKIVNSIILGPGERYIAEVLFGKEGKYKIVHKTPSRTYVLGHVNVAPSSSKPDTNFTELREDLGLKSSFEEYRKYSNAKPDYRFELNVNQKIMVGMGRMPFEDVEWEESGHMAMMNRMSDVHNIKWVIKDLDTGKENMEINHKVGLGEIKKIRIINAPNSVHPMQHPMHIHGQRFLVLNIDGKPNENLAWKDTVLVPAGKTVDILVEFTNPGTWMMHCHIAEHLEAGMMAMFTVT